MLADDEFVPEDAGMSEYQYYEFQAIDQPLSEKQMRELRGVSTRATITSTRFTNHYEWGDFKGDPAAWMERYFDVFVYVANWGTREFILRLPRQALDLKLARRYCRGDAASVRAKGEFVILSFLSDDESGDGGEWDDGTGWLSGLAPLRADLAAADHRALYLAWLWCVQCGEVEDGAEEPPVPSGLGRLNAPLRSFADFLRLDPDLVAAAAEASADIEDALQPRACAAWIAALPQAEKDGWLLRLALGEERNLRAELLRRLRPAQGKAAPVLPAPRTVAQLCKLAELRRRRRRRREAEKAAAERARYEKEQAALRDAKLDQLGRRESEAWGELGRLIARKTPREYDIAIELLKDLGELAARQGRSAEFARRIEAIKVEHSRKPRFIERLEQVGLS
jgi:hypothetical protein